MPDTKLTIRADSPIGTISPRLYGHFAEHLGRCCYEGLWVGTNATEVPHQEGFSSDVLEALKAMPVPLLRWPGGCYADHYHWRDGIGPVNQRPRRLGMSCGLTVEDDNSLGTHEFLRLCQLLGAEPYLAGNVGSGTPQELCDWMEYCNSSHDSTLARERIANGSPKPFNVPLWGVGNENWGCGGNYDAATYAREYRRYATMLRHIDPTAELVICGFDDAWNIELLQTLGKHEHLTEHLSIHHYWTEGGPEIDFTEDDYYALLTEAATCEDFINRTAAIIRDTTSGKHRIGIALDEWGVWHPEARNWGKIPDGLTPRSPVTYEQAGTLRDAIAAAIALEGFHRQCQVLTLANLAQIVNILHAPVMTEGAVMWLTPTYHLLRMHTPHIGATALPVEIEQSDRIPGGASAVTATASRNNNGTTITLTNRHFSQPASVQIEGVHSGVPARGQILTADSPRAINSANQPDNVKLADFVANQDGANLRVDLPQHSVVTIVVG